MDEVVRHRIHAVWDGLVELGAARIEDGLEYALTELSALLDAQQAYWLGAVRVKEVGRHDPLFGWRPRAIRYLKPSSEFDALYRQQRRRIYMGGDNPTVVPKLLEAGKFRVLIQHKIVPGDWFGMEMYKTLYAPLGIQDIILVATPLGPEVESWFAFERIHHPEPCFSDAEQQLLDYAVRPLKWLHRQLMLHHGVLLADKPLKPSERRVLCELLTEKTEQRIAEELGLTINTVHTYCKRICRKFNVRGRAGLLALWLGQLPER